MLQLKKINGFTLIELLVVIAIIGVLSTLAVIALGSARTKARDAKRMSDLNQISKALELYYADNNTYPLIITPGHSLTSLDGSEVYMNKIPSNPTPRDDGDCPDLDYSYGLASEGNDYRIYSCLGSSYSQLSSGGKAVTANGIINSSTFPPLGVCGGQQGGSCPAGKQCCLVSEGSCYGYYYTCFDMGMCPGGISMFCSGIGQSCTDGGECNTGICRNDVCACNDIGRICDYNSNCCSENCSFGICQENEGFIFP